MSATFEIPRARLRLEPKERASWQARIVVPIASVLTATLAGALALAVDGHSPLEAYAELFQSAFGGRNPLVRTLLLSTPLVFTALAAAVSFRMRIWNIGGDGQLMMGAIAASGVAISLPESPFWVLMPAIMVAGIVGGMLWAGIGAVLKVFFSTDEVISTLMLTFIATHFMEYLIFGSFSYWRDPESVAYATGKPIPEVAELPRFWGRLHVGFLIAFVVAVLIWWILKASRWGYETKVIGDSPTAGRYAGMSVSRNIIAVLCVSGALAGLGGAVEVAGVNHALQPTALETGVGFTGIIAASMARLHPLMLVPVSVFLSGLVSSGTALQQMGIPIDIVLLLQGLVLLFVAAGEFFLRYRVTVVSKRGPP